MRFRQGCVTACRLDCYVQSSAEVGRRLEGVSKVEEKKKVASPGFVELMAAHPAAAECVIEFESKGGSKMRIQWKGSGAPDWGSLLRAWREAER